MKFNHKRSRNSDETLQVVTCPLLDTEKFTKLLKHFKTIGLIKKE